jgi:TPR repeat protein
MKLTGLILGGSFFLAASSLGAQTGAPDLALLSKANAGDAAAQVDLGEHYQKAAASEQDTDQKTDAFRQAAEWYRKAAEQGNLSGEIHLADLYRDGEGVPRDMNQAAAWYRKAADQGDAAAQGTMGVLYSMGQGVPRDNVEAYFWFALAAGAEGPNQQKYAANRQAIGTQITTDELTAVQQRIKKWKAAHPPTNSAGK